MKCFGSYRAKVCRRKIAIEPSGSSGSSAPAAERSIPPPPHRHCDPSRITRHGGTAGDVGICRPRWKPLYRNNILLCEFWQNEAKFPNIFRARLTRYVAGCRRAIDGRACQSCQWPAEIAKSGSAAEDRGQAERELIAPVPHFSKGYALAGRVALSSGAHCTCSFIERCSKSAGELYRIVIGPEMKEEETWLLVQHVAVNSSHFDAV